MISGNAQLHVVFGRSAAGTLQQTLELVDQAGLVVAPYDDFSFGPIDKDCAAARAAWVERELGYSDWQSIIDDSLPVLTASLAASQPPIAWISPNTTRSVTGFLWWLSHMEDRDCLILEVPDLSLLDPRAMGEYLDQAQALSAARRANCLALWAQLQTENAPLRVLDDEGLKSAPLNYFDTALLGHATSEWQKMARIVAGVLGDFSEAGISQTGDLVLASRIADLAEAGTLEWRGDLGYMAHCEIRLP